MIVTSDVSGKDGKWRHSAETIRNFNATETDNSSQNNILKQVEVLSRYDRKTMTKTEIWNYE